MSPVFTPGPGRGAAVPRPAPPANSPSPCVKPG